MKSAPAWRHRVDTILVAGVDTVVGANLAAVLAETHRVVGLSASPVSIAECETTVCLPIDSAGIKEWIGLLNPSHVVCCGSAARSCWEMGSEETLPTHTVAHAEAWAQAAARSGARLTLVS